MILKFVKKLSYCGSCHCSTLLLKRFYSPTAAISRCIEKDFIITKQTAFVNKPLQNIYCPNRKDSFFKVFDEIPLLDISLPNIKPIASYGKLDLPDTKPITSYVDEPSPNVVIQCKGGILKIRKKKMNKHKYKKRRKRDRAKIRKVLIMRLRRKRKIKAHKKEKMVEKIKNRLEQNPKDKYGEQPYVIHRLMKW